MKNIIMFQTVCVFFTSIQLVHCKVDDRCCCNEFVVNRKRAFLLIVDGIIKITEGPPVNRQTLSSV